MRKKEFNHNFVIFATKGSPYYDYGYYDILNHPQVKYINCLFHGINSKIIKLILKLLGYSLINKTMGYLLGSIAYSKVAKHSFQTDDPICYVFFVDYTDFCYSGYLKYLKKKYKNVKTVLYLQDIISSRPNFDIAKAKANFDEVMSYDIAEAEKFKLLYYPTPMSYVNVPPDVTLGTSDLYFCGKAKNRYVLIHDIFKRCTELGMSCDFNIIDHPKGAERIPGINYLNKVMSYEQNIQHLQKTQCVLEIMQEGAIGFTPRLWEAIIYDCHLLTNNKEINRSEYFIDGLIHIIGSDCTMPKNFKDKISKVPHYPKEMKLSLSPKALLEFLD